MSAMLFCKKKKKLHKYDLIFKHVVKFGTIVFQIFAVFFCVSIFQVVYICFLVFFFYEFINFFDSFYVLQSSLMTSQHRLKLVYYHKYSIQLTSIL